MKVLIANLDDFVLTERTTLNAAATAGSNISLTLENTSGMADNTYLVIGYPGAETCELQQINAAVSGATAAQVATLKFAHQKGEPVAVIRYNKRKFYGATSSTGTFTELTTYGSPADIQVDDPQGTTLEYTGSEGYTYFKATYFNSETGEETDPDDTEAVLADESARYCSIYAIKTQAGLTNNPFITDSTIETYRKRAENEVNSYLFATYTLPLAEIPFIVENVTTLLAAGYLDYQEFGKDGEGVKWLGEARGVLKAIQKGTQRLIGADGTELARKTTSTTVTSYPDTVDNDEGPTRMFTTGQTF